MNQNSLLTQISGGAFALLVLGAIAFGIAGYVDIDPGEVGIVIGKIGKDKGMKEATLPIGTTWINPITNDVVVYNTRQQQYQAQLTDMPSQTSDGQPVLVDLSLEIGLDKPGVPTLHDKVGEDWYSEVIYPATRSAVRDLVPSASSDEVYTEEGRSIIQKKIQAFLTSKGKPYGILINVNLRAIDFENKAFVKKIEAKAIAQQEIEIENRNALTAENTAKKMANLAEGEKQKRIKAAEAKREEARLEGEGRRLQKEEDAIGILAIATAEAEGIKLRRLAYAGEGGTELVSIAWAENLGPNVKVYGFPTGAPGTNSIMDLNGMMQGAFKGSMMPAGK